MQIESVKVIPLTFGQRLQYSRYIDGVEFQDMPKVSPPALSEEQFDAMPDIIDGWNISYEDKMNILLDTYDINIWGRAYYLNENNELMRFQLHEDYSEGRMLVKPEDVVFIHALGEMPRLGDIFTIIPPVFRLDAVTGDGTYHLANTASGEEKIYEKSTMEFHLRNKLLFDLPRNGRGIPTEWPRDYGERPMIDKGRLQ